MLQRYLNREEHPGVDVAFDSISSYARSQERISSSTHNYYRYPACFPPQMVRELIRSFSKPGDTVLDPFMGGGTTLVESTLLGRNAVGSDINDLAVFVSKLKTYNLSQNAIDEIEDWGMRLAKTQFSGRANLPADFEGINVELGREIYATKKSADRLNNRQAQFFAKGIVLRCAKASIDGREKQFTPAEFRRNFQVFLDEMLTEAIAFDAHRKFTCESYNLEKTTTASVVSGDITRELCARKIQALSKKPTLVVTSPPYPGISVLYNKWQIHGRRETRLPYWIIDSDQYKSASFYTMGYPKAKKGVETYFRSIEASFTNVRSCVDKGALMIQIVAFGDRRTQFFPYLAAMRNAGFQEISNVNQRSFDGRLWREVPNRRWYNRVSAEVTKRKEVIFFFTAR